MVPERGCQCNLVIQGSSFTCQASFLHEMVAKKTRLPKTQHQVLPLVQGCVFPALELAAVLHVHARLMKEFLPKVSG